MSGVLIKNTLLINDNDSLLNITSNLRSYAFDYSLQGYLVGASLKALKISGPAVPINTATKTGKYSGSYTDIFYNRIWILPPELNIDGAPPQFSTNVIVWNSYFSDVTITGITSNNLSGVSISGVTSGVFKGLESKTYTVSLSGNVGAVVDGYYQFIFSNAEDPILKVVGTLALDFPYKHNWTDDYVETYVLKSDVLESHNGKEQTYKLTANPRRTLSMSVLLADNTTIENINVIRSKFYNSMAFGKAKPWLVPIWPDVQTLQSDVSAGTNVINVPTTNFDFKVGGYVYIYKNQSEYEVASVQGLTSNSITLSANLSKSWQKGTNIVPIVSAIMQEDSIKGSLINYGVESFSIVWTVNIKDNAEINKIGTYTADSYQGHLLFLWKHNFTEDPSVEIYSPNRLLDNEVGNFLIDPRYNFTRTRSTFSYLLKNRQELSTALGFFKAVNGRQKPFWMPTYANEIQVVGSGISTSNIIKIKDIGYNVFIKQNPNQRDVMLVKSDGSYIIRRITSSVNNGDGTEDLTLNQTIGFNWTANSFKEGHFLKLARLDQDSLEVTYLTNTITNISFVIVDIIQA